MGKKINSTLPAGYRIQEAQITISYFTHWDILTPESFYDDDDIDHDSHQEIMLPADKF
jgi:hypothetical protein